MIGNPPYISKSKVEKKYKVISFKTSRCTDIYALVIEKSTSLVNHNGKCGMIVPLSLGFSADFESCRELIYSQYSVSWFSSFGRIPAALFNSDVRVRNTIFIGDIKSNIKACYTTRLHRWFEEERPFLLDSLSYCSFNPKLWNSRIPKINTQAMSDAFEGLFRIGGKLGGLESAQNKNNVLHFKKSAYNWLNFCREMPPCFVGETLVEHTKFGSFFLKDELNCKLAMALANGKLMLIFWFIISDDFDVTKWNFTEFPTDFSGIDITLKNQIIENTNQLELAMVNATSFKLNAGRRVGNYNLAKCRYLTDMTDIKFAEALGILHAWEDFELYYAQTMKTDFDED